MGRARFAVTAIVLIVAAATSACSNGQAVTATPTTTATTSPTATPTASPTVAAPPSTTTVAPTNSNGAALNSHGNIVKAIGQEGGLTGAAGTPVVRFTVTGIRKDPPCDAPGAAKPMNGHYLAVDMHITTDPALPVNTVVFSEKDMTVIGPDGVTDTNVVGYGFTCLRNRFTDLELAPGQTYVGSFVLDTAVTTGSVTFKPASVELTNGWEWPIP